MFLGLFFFRIEATARVNKILSQILNHLRLLINAPYTVSSRLRASAFQNLIKMSFGLTVRQRSTYPQKKWSIYSCNWVRDKASKIRPIVVCTVNYRFILTSFNFLIIRLSLDYSFQNKIECIFLLEMHEGLNKNIYIYIRIRKNKIDIKEGKRY